MSKQFLLINKPSGPTSHDVVDEVRRISGESKVGHAGTLDPFASGLLLVAVGRESTREISKFVGMDKEYVAKIKLGAVSDTYDKTGNIRTQEHPWASLRAGKNIKTKELVTQAFRPDRIRETLKQFIGEQEQLPPMFSAKKVRGQKLYKLARQGIEIERKPHKITIHDIKLLKWSNVNGQMSIVVHCSSGTYIRTLAHDIGQALGCGAYLEELVRTKIGPYKLEDAVELDKLNKNNWQELCIKM